MKCKSFAWYMKTITPEIPRPFDDAVYYGEVFSEKTEACWYIADDSYMAMTYFCFFHRVLPENIFYIDNRQRLKFKNQCLRVEFSTWLLKLEDCPKEDIPEKWDVIHYREIAGWTRVTITKDDGKKEELCLTQVTNINTAHYKEQMPQLMACDFQNEFQHWRWTYKFDFNYNFDKPVLWWKIRHNTFLCRKYFLFYASSIASIIFALVILVIFPCLISSHTIRRDPFAMALRQIPLQTSGHYFRFYVLIRLDV